MPRFLWILPVIFLGGCAGPARRPDADIFGNGFRNAARAIAVGRAYDSALIAERRGDGAAFEEAVERLHRSQALLPAKLADSLNLVLAEAAVTRAVGYDSLAQRPQSANADKNRAEAEKNYRLALELSPDFPSEDPENLNALGYFLADNGHSNEDFHRAELLTRRALKLWDKRLNEPLIQLNPAILSQLRFGRELSAHDSLSWALYRQNRFEEALREQIEAVTAAKANAPKSPQADSGLADMFYHLGKIQQALGHLPEARGAFAEALKLQPDHEKAKQEAGK